MEQVIWDFRLYFGGIKAFGIENVTFAEKSEEVCASVEKKTGLKHSESNAKLITDCDYIVPCVKPQFFKSVAADLKENLNVDKVIISIMAGVSIDDIKEATFPYQKGNTCYAKYSCTGWRRHVMHKLQ